MSKSTKTVTLSPEDLDRMKRRNAAMEKVHEGMFEIIKADMSDGKCDYKMYYLKGCSKGRPHAVKGNYFFEEALPLAFKKMNVHLAAICGVFKLSNIEVNDIDKFHDHDLTALYEVTGFEMGGTIDTPKVKLAGTAYMDVARTRVEIKTKSITLDNLAGYQWYNELLQAIKDVQLEVALYECGFYVPTKEDDDEDKMQGDLFNQGERAEEVVDQLEAGKVS